MALELTGEARREKIIALLQGNQTPLSGTELGRITGVSRQVIVQDIALLRAEGQPILATTKGYLLGRPTDVTRLIKVRHTNEQTEEELNTVVNLGGCVEDVIVNHRTYGKLTAPLHIRTQQDVQAFMEQIRTGKSSPLMNITSGYHFHHITAACPETLDTIEKKLKEMGFLAEILPYERGNV